MYVEVLDARAAIDMVSFVVISLYYHRDIFTDEGSSNGRIVRIGNVF